MSYWDGFGCLNKQVRLTQQLGKALKAVDVSDTSLINQTVTFDLHN